MLPNKVKAVVISCMIIRGGSRGFHRFPETGNVFCTGILCQYNLLKQSRLMDNTLIKQS